MATEPTDMNAVLDLPMQENDADARTVREYLAKLAELMWTENEGVDGKRPFGNSDWQSELYPPLVLAGFVDGRVIVESRTWVDDCDEGRADRLITQAIREMGRKPVAPGLEDYWKALGEIRSDVSRARAILAQHDAHDPGEVR